MKSQAKNPKFRAVEPEVWRALFRAVHPVKTAACVAADLGAPVSTVETWLSGASAPSLGWFLAILRCYGPNALALTVPGCGWISAAARAERQRALIAEQARLGAEIEQLRRLA